MRRRAGSPADEREGLESKESQCTKLEHAYCLGERKRLFKSETDGSSKTSFER